MVQSKNAIVVRGLQKSFGSFKALKGITFNVSPGSIMALLGPNGAGKTTTIRMLSTLIRPDTGTATIAGHDILEDAAAVRQNIGLTGQFAAVDEYLTGEENLRLIARLYRMSPEETSRQTKKLLRDFDLVEVAKRPVRTYSGGMKRRIDLAMSLIASPPVIFLDEPTTGLDPRSRLTMWQIIKQMASSGTTILLTTQYMEEADYLANSILVIDDGQVIAEGTPDELKARVGSDRLEFTFKNTGHFEKAKAVIATDAMQADRDRQVVSIPSDGGVGTLRTILRQLDDAQIAVDGVSLHRPTLDDVFMSLTGREASVDDQVKRS